MQRIWVVVVSAAVVLPIGCKAEQQLEFVQFGEVEPGCDHADAAERGEVARIARNYFLSEVGVPIAKTAFGRVSRCRDRWIVPILASTEQVPTPRVWYVEISRPESVPYKLLRPM